MARIASDALRRGLASSQSVDYRNGKHDARARRCGVWADEQIGPAGVGLIGAESERVPMVLRLVDDGRIDMNPTGV